MARRVKLQRREGVALVTLPGAAQAPGLGFDAELRSSLAGALDLAFAEPGLQAVVLRAGGGLGRANGSDEAETAGGWPLDEDPLADMLPAAAASDRTAPGIAALAARISAAPVPVIALLSGRIAGGALALAQAASLRMALADTVFAAPEPALGLIPGGGTLVRLARRAGGAAALGFLASARDWSAEEARAAGLCDAVSSGGALETAVLGVALQAVRGGAGPRRDRGLADPAAYLAALEEARAGLAPALAEPGRGAALARAFAVAEAVALLPEDEALAFEQVAFDDLAADPQARGLIHAAAVHRAGRHLAGLETAGEGAGFARIGLWNQPERLALALLETGAEVVLGASDPGLLEPAFMRIAAAQEAAVAEGRREPEAREEDWSRLSAATDLAGLMQGAPERPALVIATPHSLAEARDLAERGEAGTCLMLEGPFGASVEAALHCDLGAHRRGDFWELHAASASGDTALPDVAARLRETGAEVIRGAPGAGLVAHLEAALILAAERTVLAGASPAAVDGALRQFGLRDGAFLRADARGLASLGALLRACGAAPGALFTYLQLEGRSGRAAGLGVYRYPGSGAAPQPAEDEAELLSALRAEAGITPRALPLAEIQARILAEMAGAGAAALQGGLAHRAGDVDLAALAGLGFPPGHGGPMFQADRAGLVAVRKRLRALAAEGAPAPVTLWDVMIRNGRHWADLDG